MSMYQHAHDVYISWLLHHLIMWLLLDLIVLDSMTLKEYACMSCMYLGTIYVTTWFPYGISLLLVVEPWIHLVHTYHPNAINLLT